MLAGTEGLAALGVPHGLAALGGGLLLAPDAGRLVVLAAACLRQDAGLLNQLIEPSQRLFKALMRANPDLGQTDPSKRMIAFVCNCIGWSDEVSSEMCN